MIEDELIRIWQSSSDQERIKFEKSRLMIELESSLDRLHRWWRYVELVEVILSVFGILICGFVVYWIPLIASKIGATLIMALLIYLLIRVQALNKHKPNSLEETYLEYLKKIRKYLEVQRKFLRTYVYWAILPCYPITLLFLFDLWNEIPAKRNFLIIICISTVVIGIYGYFLNKKRVKNEINPRINSVDKLIEELKG